MYTDQPTMQDLFVQLGLDSSDEAIDNFIEKHRGMNDSRHIEEAPFWNDSQSEFLKSALEDDAEWAEVIDQLNVQLHQD
ncbi:DUF2789 domain-containing protein [Alteromonas sp. ASW11-19]|uniref:DUF2789 domain-containing protein n=1 Tax=Alteromonas salexigens TaxID=2982530 RepID=A0ABT2VRA2_9ALTE|nr:DUF2789 domain-containing protein [Alteromonas salexigens]MCU7555837.1 DUF2789 domain-containing protein [Alteromonas salexigens]